MKHVSAAAILGGLAILLVGCSSDEAGEGSSNNGSTVSEFSQELHDQLPEDVRERGVISFVGDPNAPWRVFEEDGSVSGFQTDLFVEFEEILGVEIETQQVTGLPAVKLGVESGRNDAAFGPILDTPAAHEDLTITSYSIARPTFLHETDIEISSIMDLCGTTVSLLDGSVPSERALDTIEEECTAAGETPPERLPLSDANQTIIAVESGRADFATMGAAAAGFAITQQPDKYAMYVSSEDEFDTDYIGMAVAADNEELQAALLGAWEVVFENGVYNDLMEEYNLGDVVVSEILVNRTAE